MTTIGMPPITDPKKSYAHELVNAFVPKLKTNTLIYDSIHFPPAYAEQYIPAKILYELYDDQVLISAAKRDDDDSFDLMQFFKDTSSHNWEEKFRENFFDDVVPFIQDPKSISTLELGDILARTACTTVRPYSAVNYYPILCQPLPITSKRISSRGDIYTSVLKNIPIIDQSTTWEKIINFRNDPAAKPQLERLKHWATYAAKEGFSQSQLQDYIQYELNVYREHMKLHEIKTKLGFLQTVIVGGADILDNLIRLKFKPIADVFFTVEKENVALLEAELDAPGRDLAYIVNAQDTFTNQ